MSVIGLLLFLWIVGGSALVFGYFSNRDRPALATAAVVRREV
ncbi:MAG: hypothetical protein U1E62_21065 [Alsobacter sp.]